MALQVEKTGDVEALQGFVCSAGLPSGMFVLFAGLEIEFVGLSNIGAK